jgi:hypothetical protein
MTARERERARARRTKPRRRWALWAVRIAAAAVIFFAGLAIGKAIGGGGGSGETNTSVRTLVPSTLTPQETVTVTVPNP